LKAALPWDAAVGAQVVQIHVTMTARCRHSAKSKATTKWRIRQELAITSSLIYGKITLRFLVDGTATFQNGGATPSGRYIPLHPGPVLTEEDR